MEFDEGEEMTTNIGKEFFKAWDANLQRERTNKKPWEHGRYENAGDDVDAWQEATNADGLNPAPTQFDICGQCINEQAQPQVGHQLRLNPGEPVGGDLDEIEHPDFDDKYRLSEDSLWGYTCDLCGESLALV
jgi:hypothetical protein